MGQRARRTRRTRRTRRRASWASWASPHLSTHVWGDVGRSTALVVAEGQIAHVQLISHGRGCISRGGVLERRLFFR